MFLQLSISGSCIYPVISAINLIFRIGFSHGSHKSWVTKNAASRKLYGRHNTYSYCSIYAVNTYADITIQEGYY